MTSYFIKKNNKYIPCIVHGIRYCKLKGINGYRLIIEIDNIRLKTNKIRNIISLSELYNIKDKYKVRLLIKECDVFNVNDFVLFYDNDVELKHSINRYIFWKDNNLKYINNIGKIIQIDTINNIKYHTVKFNSDNPIKILSSCLIKLNNNIVEIQKVKKKKNIKKSNIFNDDFDDDW